MTISQIEIKNIKGISHKCINVQLMANKPNLLIAPNGFGKSSIATAFSSMNTKRIALTEKDYHGENDELMPELNIIFNGYKLTADKTKNEIQQKFNVLVINSGLIPKAKKNFKGSVTPSLEINPITICKTPIKTEFPYKNTESKANFGPNGKILPNISNALKDTRLLDAIEEIDFSKLNQPRIHATLTTSIEKINQQNGTTATILQWILENCDNDFLSVKPLSKIGDRLAQLGLVDSKLTGFLAAYQISCIYLAAPKQFNAALEWLKYTSIKTNYEKLLTNFKSSNWQWAKVEETKKGTLIISFPKAYQLSNGQRDIITLVVHLHKAFYEGSKKPLILVVDEVFDYLDDANLVAFQYYVTSIIDAYKERGQVIYPLILTHLDPGVFFDFCFNKHKLQINHLQVKPTGKSQDTLRLIEARDSQDLIKERLEKHWFHFHKDTCEIPENEWPINLPQEWRFSNKFQSQMHNELTRYIENKNYDPLAACFAVRVAVEKLCYDLLNHGDQQDEFLATKKTKNKIDFAGSTGKEISESFFLLGLIYNTNLHWNQGRDYVSPLATKLSHPTIKQLISGIFDQVCGNKKQNTKPPTPRGQ